MPTGAPCRCVADHESPELIGTLQVIPQPIVLGTPRPVVNVMIYYRNMNRTIVERVIIGSTVTLDGVGEVLLTDL